MPVDQRLSPSMDPGITSNYLGRYTSVKQVNKALNESTTRCKGLMALNTLVENFSDDIFTEHCLSWMQACLKYNATNASEIVTACSLLLKLLKMAKYFPELVKTVTNFISTRFFDQFYKHLITLDEGWLCMEFCFSSYNGCCGTQKDSMEKKILEKLTSGREVNPTVARCFALLPSLGGGGVKGVHFITAWKQQFAKTVDACQDFVKQLSGSILDTQEVLLSNGVNGSVKNQSAEMMAICLSNYSIILKSMLLEPFPVMKVVPIDKVLGLVCSGLAVTPNTLTIKTTEGVLPKVHCSLLGVLEAMIVACAGHMCPYAHLICRLVKQTLDWTGQAQAAYGREKPYLEVRVAAYNVLSNWLVTAGNGSCAEMISKHFISCVLSDVYYKGSTLALQPSKSTVAQTEIATKRMDRTANGKLCFTTLQTLVMYLKSVGHLLRPEEHKALQTAIISLILDFQKTTQPEDMLIPYSLPKCREAAYAVLVALALHPSPKWPPPTQFALGLLAAGQRDPDLRIRLVCTSAAATLENILHSGFSASTFQTSDPGQGEARDRGRDVPNEEEMEVEVEEELLQEAAGDADGEDEGNESSASCEGSKGSECEVEDEDSNKAKDRAGEECVVEKEGSNKGEECEVCKEPLDADLLESRQTNGTSDVGEEKQGADVEVTENMEHDSESERDVRTSTEQNTEPNVIQEDVGNSKIPPELPLIEESSKDSDSDNESPPAQKQRRMTSDSDIVEVASLSPSSSICSKEVQLICEKVSGYITPDSQSSQSSSKRKTKGEKPATPQRKYNLRSSPITPAGVTNRVLRHTDLSPVSELPKEGDEHASKASDEESVKSVSSMTTRSKAKNNSPLRGKKEEIEKKPGSDEEHSTPQRITAMEPPQKTLSMEEDSEDEDILTSFDESLNTN